MNSSKHKMLLARRQGLFTLCVWPLLASWQKMASNSKVPARRKRALARDRDEVGVHSLRELLAGRKMSTGLLRSMLTVVQAAPEIASIPIAISESMFETVRHTEIVRQTDGSDFHWDMCQPNLLLARTKVYVDTLAEKPSSREHPWHIVRIRATAKATRGACTSLACLSTMENMCGRRGQTQSVNRPC